MNIHLQRISDVMPKFYKVRDMSLDDALQIIRSIEADLIAVLPELQADSNDYRLGNATYGYSGSEKALGDLNYISDRWRCAFRVAWMLGLINQDYR